MLVYLIVLLVDDCERLHVVDNEAEALRYWNEHTNAVRFIEENTDGTQRVVMTRPTH